MPTIQLDAENLRNLVKSQFRSVNQMIHASPGWLTSRDRPAIYRAFNGYPIKKALADSLATVLGVHGVKNLLPNRSGTKDRLTLEAETFYVAIKLIRNCRKAGGGSPFDQAVQAERSIELLQCELDVPAAVFSVVLSELVRSRCIEVRDDKTWCPAEIPLDEVTRLLKRRIMIQWSMVRDICSQSWGSRKRIANRIRTLALDAETKVADPLQFFNVDDQIHACFCADVYEVELLQSSRGISWGIAHSLTTDLLEQREIDPVNAERSMKMATGWMLEDYQEWSDRLADRRTPDLGRMHRSLRRHVLRMRDYAQYYQTKPTVQGLGEPKPGSVASCRSMSF